MIIQKVSSHVIRTKMAHHVQAGGIGYRKYQTASRKRTFLIKSDMGEADADFSELVTSLKD
jgi:hypothetical protein